MKWRDSARCVLRATGQQGVTSDVSVGMDSVGGGAEKHAVCVSESVEAYELLLVFAPRYNF